MPRFCMRQYAEYLRMSKFVERKNFDVIFRYNIIALSINIWPSINSSNKYAI